MGKGKSVKKGKKKKKNTVTSKKYLKYKIDGDKVTSERHCPRCGPGIFLMNSKGRIYCGKCHYAEFETSQKEEVKEASSNAVDDTKEEVKSIEEPNNLKVTRGPEEKK